MSDRDKVGAKSSGANTIYIIDDAVRSDDFSMDIYMAQSGKTLRLSSEGIQHSGSTGSLGANQFGADKVFALFKTVSNSDQVVFGVGVTVTLFESRRHAKKTSGRVLYQKCCPKRYTELEQLQQLSAEKGITNLCANGSRSSEEIDLGGCR